MSAILIYLFIFSSGALALGMLFLKLIEIPLDFFKKLVRGTIK